MPAKASCLADVTLRPLSSRSVILSLLLAVHPPELPVRQLVRCVEPLGVTDATLRVALSRMLASGDLRRTDSGYRLAERLVERQHRQDDAIKPRTRAWHGDWEVAVVTATGRGPAERAQLRDELSGLRLAQLREGVWLRPANLRRPWPDHLDGTVQRFLSRPDQPHGSLADQLWRLGDWAATATALLRALGAAARPADSFTVAAAIVRHLRADPVLPRQLLPADWPGSQLRTAYGGFRQDVLRLAQSPGRERVKLASG